MRADKCVACGSGWTCGRQVWAKGLCGAHYTQAARGGALTRLRRYTDRGSTPEELLSSCADEGVRQGGCLLWPRALSNGYGKVRTSAGQFALHRLAYEVRVGPLPSGSVVHHTCGNKNCFEASHLQAVTPQENTAESLRNKALTERIAELENKLKDRDETDSN